MRVLPSRNALILMFALDDLYLHGAAGELRKAVLWLLRAIREGRYSSSAITTIQHDLTMIRNAGSGQAALQALHSTIAARLDFHSSDVLRRYDEDPFLRRCRVRRQIWFGHGNHII